MSINHSTPLKAGEKENVYAARNERLLTGEYVSFYFYLQFNSYWGRIRDDSFWENGEKISSPSMSLINANANGKRAP